ncbi:hypothetical protein CAOG_01332 [Capsaspora owczarzaki ATCC 30864]|uniref:Uncharacterized protein n=1 Tax=Capsaspora owczarzaki (strain ATCC 30864) TaxID=595528 RepID=A0A0D2VIW6_CAPO3|nr:hypothetical protein CAOG_01332 [Capsaspora owczarzaki ATCC 30864]KJE89932.1 hypothetical protein CAOG_001332 [Capsaspora owczarzaki ATCC 30864]|eukprot:XP_004349852.1 hypothetical protein CAOG_01332 [Capsaspora owczarzaki ATCC 30864]
MAGSARMKKSNDAFHGNVNKRGIVKPTTRQDDKYPVGPAVLALFIFVVCGSAIFQIFQTVRSNGV